MRKWFKKFLQEYDDKIIKQMAKEESDEKEMGL